MGFPNEGRAWFAIIWVLFVFQVLLCQSTPVESTGDVTKPFLPAIWFPEPGPKCSTTKINMNTTKFDFTWNIEGLWYLHKNVLIDQPDKMFFKQKDFKLEGKGAEVNGHLEVRVVGQEVKSEATLIIKRNSHIKDESTFFESVKNSDFKAQLTLQIGSVSLPLDTLRGRTEGSGVKFSWGPEVLNFPRISDQLKDSEDVDWKLVYNFTHFSVDPTSTDTPPSDCTADKTQVPNQLGEVLEILQPQRT